MAKRNNQCYIIFDYNVEWNDENLFNLTYLNSQYPIYFFSI